MKASVSLINSITIVTVLITGALAALNEVTLSKLHGSQLEPLFILSTISSSISLWKYREWRAASIALMFLTAFSVHEWSLIHNLSAATFFIISSYLILIDKRLRYWSIGFFIAAVAYIHSLLAFEVIAISTILAFHIHYFILISSVFRDRFSSK